MMTIRTERKKTFHSKILFVLEKSNFFSDMKTLMAILKLTKYIKNYYPQK